MIDRLPAMPAAEMEEQLIQIAARTAAWRRDSEMYARTLTAGIDWMLLAQTLQRRRLLATLGPRILDFGDAPPSFCEAVDASIAAGRRHGAILQLVSLRALEMLARDGIRASILKGPLMGEALYGDPGRRPSNDIDLLVSPEQLRTAIETVRQLGYRAPVDFVDGNGLPLLHFVLEHERGELPPIELHWRVHWYEREFAHDRLLPPTTDRASTWRPAPADELMALLLYYARDGFVGLRLASDLGAWWDARGHELRDGELTETISAYPALGRAAVASAVVSARTVGLPYARILGTNRRLTSRQWAAARLANPHPRSSRAQIYADIGLIDGLLMPSGELGSFIRRQVLPPLQVRDQQARQSARAQPRSSVSRAIGILARYGMSATRLLRPTRGLA